MNQSYSFSIGFISILNISKNDFFYVFSLCEYENSQKTCCFVVGLLDLWECKLMWVRSKSRCVICLLFGIWKGGGKVSTFFVTCNLFISATFRATMAIKVCKLIFMIKRIDWRALEMRARGCARGKHPSPITIQNRYPMIWWFF